MDKYTFLFTTLLLLGFALLLALSPISEALSLRAPVFFFALRFFEPHHLHLLALVETFGVSVYSQKTVASTSVEMSPDFPKIGSAIHSPSFRISLTRMKSSLPLADSIFRLSLAETLFCIFSGEIVSPPSLARKGRETPPPPPWPRRCGPAARRGLWPLFSR